MITTNAFLSGISFFASVLALIIALIAWFQPSDHKQANRFLALTLVFFAVDVLYYGIFASIESIAFSAVYLLGVGHVNMLLILPFAFLYIGYLYKDVITLPRHLWLHFIPFGLVFLASLPIFLADFDDKWYLINLHFKRIIGPDIELQKYYGLVLLGSGILLWGQMLLYSIVMIRIYRAYRNQLLSLFSDMTEIKTRWIAVFIFLLVTSLTIYTVYLIEIVFFQNLSHAWYVNSQVLIECLVFLYIGAGGILHPHLFSFKQQTTLAWVQQHKNPQYRFSNLTDAEARAIKSDLIELMQTEKPYLEPELSLADLAEQLGMSQVDKLSQVFTTTLNENFYRFINRHRIEHAQQELRQPSQRYRSMLDLANAVGFNSTSVFYSRFKEFTQMTPTEYKKAQQNTSL